MHGAHVHIVDIVNIPTSISVKWESDPQCPPSDISSATHTGSNEFELDTLCTDLAEVAQEVYMQ